MLEHSETSDNRPFITSDTSPETISEEQTSNVEPLYTRQQSEQSEQETLANLFQNSDPPQEQPLSQISDIQQPNPSETTTIHDTSEFSEDTVQNTRRFTITDDSNIIISPTHNITQNNLTTKIKTTLLLQIQTIPLFYLHPILILHNPLRHKYHLLEIIIHLLFHLNSQLR